MRKWERFVIKTWFSETFYSELLGVTETFSTVLCSKPLIMLLFCNSYLKQKGRIAKPGQENKDLFMISSEYAVNLAQWISTVNDWFMRQFAFIDIWSTWWDLRKIKDCLVNLLRRRLQEKQEWISKRGEETYVSHGGYCWSNTINIINS